MGTPAFMEFVESIQSEGVTFERVPMGGGATAPGIADRRGGQRERGQGHWTHWTFALPKLLAVISESSRISTRSTPQHSATEAPAEAIHARKKPARSFSRQCSKLKSITRSSSMARPGRLSLRGRILRAAAVEGPRLVGGYDVLYGKVKTFLRDYLFTASPVDLEDPVVLRNLSEPEAGKILFDSFKTAINALDGTETRATSGLKTTSGCATHALSAPSTGATVTAKKSIFSKIVGERKVRWLRTRFRRSSWTTPRTSQAFAKNYLAVGFKLDYVKADGDLSNYTPDFIVRTHDGTVWIVETKGAARAGSPAERWRACASGAQMRPPPARRGWRRLPIRLCRSGRDSSVTNPQTFAALAASFTEYQGA